MRNIPVFTTEFGVASLILESIVGRKEAFIRIQSSLEPGCLLEEAAAFCRSCGAEHVYAAGHEMLETYPLHTVILQLSAPREAIGETDACLFPVQEHTAEKWRQIYNQRMAGVKNAAWMTETAMKKLVKEGSAYFVHRNGVLLGIGKASGSEIDAVAAVVPGAGETVMRALATLLTEDTVRLTVSDRNLPALRLYERMGFLTVGEVSRWYQIL